MTASCEERIQASIAQLRASNGDYSQIHAEQAAKRLAWWDANKDRLSLSGPVPRQAHLPRQAYTLFLLCYLGLEPGEVPVVYEDERKIAWRSYNFCSQLEACVRLGLNTREVCRHSSEESVQVLIARLDPRLRFSRNYVDGIRPYAEYCEEMIELCG